MNNILAYILGALLLMVLYQWYNGQTLRNNSGKASEFFQKISGSAKEMVEDLFDDESTDEGEAATSAPVVHSTAPTGAIRIPMEDTHQAAYPAGILPGKVGTFHPTQDCDRFICNGCGTTPCNCMTDDRGRNYPALIDAIRRSKTNEYPFYNLN